MPIPLLRLSLLLGVMMTVSMPHVSLAQNISAGRPELKVGDRWKHERRSSMTQVVIYTDETVVAGVSPAKIDVTVNGQPGVWTPDLTTLESPRLSNDPGYQLLQFPMEVGKKWEFKTKWRNKENGNSGNTQMEVQVKAQEKIKVAAGEFEAFRVEGIGYMNFGGGGNGTVKVTYWYSPQAKAIARFLWVDGRNNFSHDLIEVAVTP